MKELSWNLATSTIQLWFEARHRYLDVAGFIADSFRERYPNFVLDHANTRNTRLASEEDELSLTYGDSTAYIGGDVVHTASSKYGEMADYLFTLLIEGLGIRAITRLGNRISHRANFSDKESTDRWLSATCAGITGGATHPWATADEKLSDHVFREVALRTRDETYDLDVTLKGFSRVLTIHGEAKRAFQGELHKLRSEIHCADLDVDVRTRKGVAIEDLNAALYFESNRKLIYKKLIPWITNAGK